MADKKYDDLSEMHKLRLNAALLGLLKSDQPKGLQEAMRSRLVGTDSEKTKGLEFIARMRNALVALPEDQLPPLTGEIKSPGDSLRVQGTTLNYVAWQMSQSGDKNTIPVGAISKNPSLNRLDSKLVYTGPINDNVKMALTKFAASEAVAACGADQQCQQAVKEGPIGKVAASALGR